MTDIKEYAAIVGEGAIDELYLLARHLQNRTIQNINSTAVGGGVAEILLHMLPMLKQLGLDVRWDVIKGDDRFFTITKKIHNALHGVTEQLTDDDLAYVVEVNRENAGDITFADVVFVHDPQPIALIECAPPGERRWVWRCHIDFSRPDPRVWSFLERFIARYNAAVFSAPSFARKLRIPQVLIAPSIDPLSDKNRELPEDVIASVFERFGIDRTRPVVTQISRFDFLKDPVGVIKSYRIAKKHVDLQLVLAGGGATDDPEGAMVLEQVKQAADADPDIFLLLLPPSSDVEINALQRGSTVILQKSLREGFGLTVAEALWKGKPTIAGAVGGIPLQITHKHSGILTHSIDGTAYWIKQLINEPAYAARLGANGHEHVKDNFLITRHCRDYLLLFLSLFHDGDTVYL